MTRAWRAASWAAPPLFCLALYWYGLKAWFRQDDFAWLGLAGDVHSWRDFLTAMFAPMAQGTIRPWSERAFFMLFFKLFGLDALPFRIWVFATQFASLTLLNAIAGHLTGSRAAGFWAAILWTANGALVSSMTWTSAYNQILCGFFLLLAFYLLLRYIGTGEERYWRAQWIVFLLGFGALEINVVYPALAILYIWLQSPKLLRKAIPLVIPSILFTLVHRAVAPSTASPTYAMQFDLSILQSLGTYLAWSTGAIQITDYFAVPRWAAWTSTALLLAALGGFAIARVRRGDKLPLFCVGWFLIVLAPVLPLRRHISDYYLTLPVIGLAILGAWGMVRGWQSSHAGATVATALALLYGAASIPAIRASAKKRYGLSRGIERMVSGVVSARQLHPDQTILLSHVNDELFWNGILDSPFRLAGVSNVFVSPESAERITPHPELGDLSKFLLTPAATLQGLEEGKLVVYSVDGERLKNITKMYAATARFSLKNEAPPRVDVADPLLSRQLGAGWYPPEPKSCWMGKRAKLRIAAPRQASDKLYISGFCPVGQCKDSPLPLSIYADGKPLTPTLLQPGERGFEREFALPAELVGRSGIELTIEVGRTFTPLEDGRELGLVFGTFEVR